MGISSVVLFELGSVYNCSMVVIVGIINQENRVVWKDELDSVRAMSNGLDLDFLNFGSRGHYNTKSPFWNMRGGWDA